MSKVFIHQEALDASASAFLYYKAFGYPASGRRVNDAPGVYFIWGNPDIGHVDSHIPSAPLLACRTLAIVDKDVYVDSDKLKLNLEEQHTTLQTDLDYVDNKLIPALQRVRRTGCDNYLFDYLSYLEEFYALAADETAFQLYLNQLFEHDKLKTREVTYRRALEPDVITLWTASARVSKTFKNVDEFYKTGVSVRQTNDCSCDESSIVRIGILPANY